MPGPEPRTVTVERFVPAPAEAVFAILVSPERHSALDGAGMVQGAPSGPGRLHLGARVTMGMRQGRLRYRSVNEVTVFEEGRALAWRTTGRWRGHTVVGGQWWRYELTPQDGGTLVRHSYEWGRARLPTVTVRLPGYPRRMARTMPESLRRLELAVLATG
ncbi:SRPBCC family protein [Blastococcus goldschmidtiae]|uniref:SRPBCC family protein n=1 Tax=Blastococcus goldschmidtiae TaxID=3075546 RepID=A0ABU2K7S5_9ACTN|nr:SRPBCC family protein [Blastococcus sp. DSM 46792]MDT0276242.1 SRPBCC family protein [Blastococcus sp. DSM 46792]